MGMFDLDLSATFVGKGVQATPLTYAHQRVGQSVHSGDVRNRRGKCAEYIDIDIADALSRGFQYAVFDVRDFNVQAGGLSGKKSVFGFMEREKPEANYTWLPATVANAVKLTTTATGTVICIIDLETREYIWVDEDSENRTAHNPAQVQEMVARYASLPEFSVYHLLKLHVESRGKLVSKDKAEKHFLFEDFSSSYTESMKYLGV
jgi:hypothetical protein